MRTYAWVLLRLLPIVAVAVLLVPPGAFGEDKDKDKDKAAEALKTASVQGKYGKLLKKIEVADDEGEYGKFNDWGHWDGTEYAGKENLPAGYWVYVAPHWYIWAEKAENARDPLKKASADGKYAKLLKKIEVPGDKEAYGEFHEYGHYTGKEWAGHKDLPPGYWVYVAPHWYIWGETVKKPMGALKKASADGKYTKLLKKIEVADDKDAYGDFNDYGFWNGMEYAGHADLPVGYWVYVAPHWYIWGDTTEK